MEFKLIETLKAADQSRAALGHVNVSDSVGLQAVTFAARDAGLPVIIGLSESERKLFRSSRSGRDGKRGPGMSRTTDFRQCRSHAFIGERNRRGESRV
jgi:fructose/tagatose bisphosphate aldolase